MVTPQLLARAEYAGEALARTVETRFADYDIVLSPTLACVPPPIGQLDAVGAARALTRALPMVAFTSLANVTGHAATSLPAGTGSDGLPIGVQLYGPGGDVTRLLPLAVSAGRGPPGGGPTWPPPPRGRTQPGEGRCGVQGRDGMSVEPGASVAIR